MMNRLVDKFKSLSPKEQKQIKLLVVMGVLGAYLFWASMTWQEMFRVEKLANRKENRIETRVGKLETPTMEQGISDKKMEQLVESIFLQEQQLRFFLQASLPLDTPAPREQLKLELSRLITDNRLRLIRLNASDDELRQSLEDMSGEALRKNIESRPVLHLRLKGRYMDLISFIDGLDKLSYRTHVTNISAELSDAYYSELDIQLELQI